MKKFYETPDAVIISLNIHENMMDVMDGVEGEGLEGEEGMFEPGIISGIPDP